MGEQDPFSETDIFGYSSLRNLVELDGEDTCMIDGGQLWMLGGESHHPSPGTQFSDSPESFKEWTCLDNQFETWTLNGGFGGAEGMPPLHNERGMGVSRPATPDLDRRGSSIDSRGEEPLFLPGATGLLSLSSQSSSVDVSHRTQSKPPWYCAECKQQFRTSQNLESHAKAAGHRAYVCKQCKKGFSRRDTYVRHAATHKSSGFHTCWICYLNKKEAVFKRKDHLHQHERNKHPQMSQPIIRRNLRTDRYGIGDDIAPIVLSPGASRASSLPPAGRSPDSEAHSNQRLQDLSFVLGSILGSTASAVHFIDKPVDMEYPSERAKIVRGLARLALLPPDRLSPERQEQLSTLADELEDMESPV